MNFPLTVSFLLHFVALVHSAVFKNDVLNQFPSSRQKNAFYQKLVPFLEPLGEFEIAPYAFNPECLSVYRTNDWFYSQCALPSNCSEPSVIKLERSFFGQETVICHSDLKHSRKDVYEFFTPKFVPKNLTLRDPISILGNDFNHLTNLTPVSFFEWFYIVKSADGRYGLLPRICDETHRNSTHLPKNVHLEHNGDRVCLIETSYTTHSCVPKLYNNIFTLLQLYDFPIEFDGVPFSQGSFSLTNNKVIGADSYITNSVGKTPIVVDKVGGSYMLTYESFDSNQPFYIVRNLRHLPTENHQCFNLLSHYSSPLTSILHHISTFIRKELSYLVEILKQLAGELALILFKIVSELFEIFMSLIPYNSEFYTSLFVMTLTYFNTRDIPISCVVFVGVYVFKIYMTSFI